jgi:hypothetical protein
MCGVLLVFFFDMIYTDLTLLPFFVFLWIFLLDGCLRFTFTQIDPEDPMREMSFKIFVDDQDLYHGRWFCLLAFACSLFPFVLMVVNDDMNTFHDYGICEYTYLSIYVCIYDPMIWQEKKRT